MATNDLDPTGTTDKPTGTTDPVSAGGSGEAVGGSDVVGELKASQEALAEERRKNAQLLSEKGTVEEARRWAAYERDAGKATDQGARPAYDPLTASVTFLSEEAARGNEQAAAQLEIYLALARQTRDDSQFARMSQNDEEQSRHYYKTGMFATPIAALKAARGDLWEREQEQFAREKATLAEAAKARAEGVVNTAPRSVSAAETVQRKLAWPEYNKMLESAPNDAARAKIMRERGNDVDYGA